MEDVARQLYLDLLKKALTDFLRTESARASAIPLEWSIQKSPLKALRNRLLTALLHRSHLFISKDDRLNVAERKSRRRSGTDWPPYAETMIGLAHTPDAPKPSQIARLARARRLADSLSVLVAATR